MNGVPPLWRITTRTPARIIHSLKGKIQPAGLSSHQGEPAPVGPFPSSLRVKSTMFLAIEVNVAAKQQLLKPPPPNKHKAKREKNVLRRLLGRVLRCDF